mmetsp:Transcript_19964/g.42106  ORF Transcript_19964/g.42106 Transcript_19964/m.42106 type:complete len:219 (+) Transcript_19964:367-1023(+)
MRQQPCQCFEQLPTQLRQSVRGGQAMHGRQPDGVCRVGTPRRVQEQPEPHVPAVSADVRRVHQRVRGQVRRLRHLGRQWRVRVQQGRHVHRVPSILRPLRQARALLPPHLRHQGRALSRVAHKPYLFDVLPPAAQKPLPLQACTPSQPPPLPSTATTAAVRASPLHFRLLAYLTPYRLLPPFLPILSLHLAATQLHSFPSLPQPMEAVPGAHTTCVLA